MLFVHLFLVSEDVAEVLDVVYQLVEFEFDVLVFVEVVEAEVFEVGNEDVFWELVLFESVGVVDGLMVGFVEVFTTTFHFDEDGSFPEEVDVTVGFVELFYFVFEGGDALAADAEDVEELDEEWFSVGFFV